MQILRDLVRHFAAQHIHDVACTKGQLAHFMHAKDGGQQLARSVGAVPDGGRVQAVVAIATGLRCLTKVLQQALAAAVRGLGQRQQGIELAAQCGLECFIGIALVNHAPLVEHIRDAIGHPRVCWQAIAPAAAGFLVVAFDVARHVHMCHKAHIGLVNAHAKRNGGHHHNAFFTQEAVLVQLAHLRRQARVVRQGVDAVVL